MTIHSGKTLPGLAEDLTGPTPKIGLTGDWTLENGTVLEALTTEARYGAVSAVAIDLAGVTRLDTAGAWIVHRMRAEFEVRGARVTLTGVPERHSALLSEIVPDKI